MHPVLPAEATLSAPPVEARTPAAALRSPNFLLFWVAQGISRFGDPITLVGLAAITYQLTASALHTSIAVLVATLPQATFGFFAGAIADALGYRRAMIAADALRAVLIGCVPIVLAIGAPLAAAYLLVLLAGLCSAVFNPARVSLVPSLLGPDRLIAGNAAVHATDRTVEIIGAVTGGILVATIGAAVFYVDALTFAIAAIMMTRVRVTEARPRRISLSGTAREGGDGLRAIRNSTVLVANTVFSLLAQLSVPVLNGLLPVLVFRRFATGNAESGAALFGFAEAGIACGAVLGSLYLGRLSRSVPKGKLVISGFAVCGAALIAAAAAPTFELLLAALLVTGFANVIFFVPNIAISQQLAPPDMRGAVIGARISLLSLSWLPIVLLSGSLGDVVDVSLLIGAAGAFTLAVALVGSRLRVLTDVP